MNMHPCRCGTWLVGSLLILFSVCWQQACLSQQVDGIPADAEPLELVDAGPVTAFRLEDKVWVRATSNLGKVTLPRFAAPLRSLRWVSPQGESAESIKLSPEPDTWIVQFSAPVAVDSVLEIQLDAAARMLDELQPISAAADGSFWLPAHFAQTHGSKLRYEPQPVKNTVGYWTNAEDYAEWTFQLDRPGRFNVGILQGCARGQGGSLGRLSVRPEESEEDATTERSAIEFEVEETGHFQNFRWRQLGELELPDSGIQKLRVKPIKIRQAALMDIRAIHLIRLPD